MTSKYCTSIVVVVACIYALLQIDSMLCHIFVIGPTFMQVPGVDKKYYYWMHVSVYTKF